MLTDEARISCVTSMEPGGTRLKHLLSFMKPAIILHCTKVCQMSDVKGIFSLRRLFLWSPFWLSQFWLQITPFILLYAGYNWGLQWNRDAVIKGRVGVDGGELAAAASVNLTIFKNLRCVGGNNTCETPHITTQPPCSANRQWESGAGVVNRNDNIDCSSNSRPYVPNQKLQHRVNRTTAKSYDTYIYDSSLA